MGMISTVGVSAITGPKAETALERAVRQERGLELMSPSALDALQSRLSKVLRRSVECLDERERIGRRAARELSERASRRGIRMTTQLLGLMREIRHCDELREGDLNVVVLVQKAI